MRLSCSTLLASKTLKSLQLLCWCGFFALPAINAQGQIDGYWPSLCTTNGTKVILVQNTATNTTVHEQHTNTECPCVQHVIHTHISFLFANTPNHYNTHPALTLYAKKRSVYSSLLPRAPPNAMAY